MSEINVSNSTRSLAVSPEGDLVAVTDQGHAQLLLFDVAASRLAVVPRDELGDAPAGVAIAGEEIWVTVPLRKIALAYARDGRPLRAVELPDCEAASLLDQLTPVLTYDDPDRIDRACNPE